MISEAQAAELVNSTLRVEPRSVTTQGLTQSGNVIFRVTLSEEQSVVLRVSPRRGAFAHTPRNLDILRQLGLPVQTVLATGPASVAGSFIILNWISGRDLIYELPNMRHDQMTRIAQTVTGYQQRVGTLPEAAAFGWAPIGKKPPKARWTDIFGPSGDAAIPADAPPLECLRARLRALRKSSESYFTTVRPICFLDDLTIKNVLIESGRLAGVIDVDFVCYGDPLMSVGTTLACIAADVGEAGHFYGEELIRCWNPSGEARRAVHFYAALWTIGFLSAAEAAGESGRADKLTVTADAMLRLAESR